MAVTRGVVLDRDLGDTTNLIILVPGGGAACTLRSTESISPERTGSIVLPSCYGVPMTSADQPLLARVATTADTEAIVATITSAFFNDPLWGPVFADEQQRTMQSQVMWRVHIASALRYPFTLVTPQVEAAAVWIPPGGTELTELEEQGLERILTQSAGEAACQKILRIYQQLDAAHPKEPCFYLSLLGVHDSFRGHGLGMSLLRDSLRRIDALGAPAYLESSNPENIARYESVGFTARDEVTVESGHTVTTMWRARR